MRVDVTEEDIRLGCRMKTMRCPIARALSRASGLAAYIGVRELRLLSCDVPEDVAACPDLDAITVKKWDTPVNLRRKIEAFDRDGVMAPFSFCLS